MTVLNFDASSIGFQFINQEIIGDIMAYKTDQQYFSITNLKMLKKFEITSKKLNLNYIK